MVAMSLYLARYLHGSTALCIVYTIYMTVLPFVFRMLYSLLYKIFTELKTPIMQKIEKGLKHG